MNRFVDLALVLLTFLAIYSIGVMNGSGEFTGPLRWFSMLVVGAWVGFAIQTRWYRGNRS